MAPGNRKVCPKTGEYFSEIELANPKLTYATKIKSMVRLFEPVRYGNFHSHGGARFGAIRSSAIPDYHRD
jgi:hypothetical protein